MRISLAKKVNNKHDLHIVYEFMSHQFSAVWYLAIFGQLNFISFFFLMTEGGGEADDKGGGVI